MTTKKKRVRVWTPEDRAAHRVFEKSRREAFNDGLIDVARQLPSLAHKKRLNKHMIVDHSISRLKAQRQLCLSASQELHELLAERDELLAEVNQWRSSSGVPVAPKEARPLGRNLGNMLQLENETFGTFANGFGENPSGDDPDLEETGDATGDDQALDMHALGELPPHGSGFHTIPDIHGIQEHELWSEVPDVPSSLPMNTISHDLYDTNQTLDPKILQSLDQCSHPTHMDVSTIHPTVSQDDTTATELCDGAIGFRWNHSMPADFSLDAANGDYIPPTQYTNLVYEPFPTLFEPYPNQSVNPLPHHGFAS